LEEERQRFDVLFQQGVQNMLSADTIQEEIIPKIRESFSFSRQSGYRDHQTKQGHLLGIISNSQVMQDVFKIVEKIAKTNSTALILGESGTGKELIADAIHKLSGRAGRLVPVNCGAIPEEILESELFGHEKGAFTGAINNRVGRFQLADGGTIFLDEIGEMSPKLQVKLLRFLQEKKIDPVGATRSIDLDVRVVAATNKNLEEEVKAGRFREDLFYRLQVVPIELPPLRERGEDVKLLAQHFLRKTSLANGISQREFSSEVLRRFAEYRWPGNVRELENLVERLAILSEERIIEQNILPKHLLSTQAGVVKEGAIKIVEIEDQLPFEGCDFNLLVDNFETHLIKQALERTSGNKKAAARLLNLNRTTLVEKIKKKGLAVVDSDELEGEEQLRVVP
jgi:transcriptional regulator with GAF, ATPase, and Fis domain